METRKTIRSFILENFYVSESNRLSDSDSLVSLGIIDSSGILEVISFLENQFGIRVEDNETIPENLGSIDNIVAFVTRKQPRAPELAAS